MRVPYGRKGDICFIPELAQLFGARGYAVLGQDVRGKFDSEGERQPFVDELRDGHETLDWVARQGWSDGRVVLLGDSYPGFTAWAAALSGHPAVRALVPRVTTTDVASWMFVQGAFRLQLMASWMAFAWSARDLRDDLLDWSVRPLRDLLAMLTGPGRPDPVARWAARSDRSRAWKQLGLKGVGRLRVPTLLVGGWWDTFARGQIRDWQRLDRSAAPAHLVMRAVDHEFHTTPNGLAPVNHMLDPVARRQMLPGLYSEVLDFLDQVMSGKPVGLPAVQFDTAHGERHVAASWPPPGVEPAQLHLVDGHSAHLGPEGGGLSPRPGGLGSYASWVHDPEDLVPSLEADPWGLLFEPMDERDVETRPDVLTFTSDAARQAYDIVGPVRLTVPFASRAKVATIVATLVDAHPDGAAFRIVEGAVRIADPRPFDQIEIDLGPTAYLVRAGHRLRLEIASSSYPRYLWEPGTGENAWHAVRGMRSENRIRLGRDARLEFAVLAGARTLYEVKPDT
jgi:putative CocE/NonD family hydrolase